MKTWFGIGLILIGGGAALLGFQILGLGLLAAGVVALAFPNRAARPDYDPEELGAEGRKLLRPLRKERDAIESLVKASPDNAALSGVGKEAVADADVLIAGAAKLILRRNEIKKLARGKAKAALDLKSLEEAAQQAATDVERDSLERAAEARRGEIQQYEKVEQAMAQLEAKVREAHTALAELRAKLAAGAVESALGQVEASELDGLTLRLKSLSQSYQEAEEFLDQKA